jgi:hypothetical protein
MFEELRLVLVGTGKLTDKGTWGVGSSVPPSMELLTRVPQAG